MVDLDEMERLHAGRGWSNIPMGDLAALINALPQLIAELRAARELKAMVDRACPPPSDGEQTP